MKKIYVLTSRCFLQSIFEVKDDESLFSTVNWSMIDSLLGNTYSHVQLKRDVVLDVSNVSILQLRKGRQIGFLF